MKENLIKDKSFDFAKSIIGLYLQLIEKHEYVLSKQLLRAGTSIGANVEESTAAISTKDFIAKLTIASKEARETRYWLRLLNETELTKDLDYKSYLSSIEEIVKILTSIIKTTQNRSI